MCLCPGTGTIPTTSKTKLVSAPRQRESVNDSSIDDDDDDNE